MFEAQDMTAKEISDRLLEITGDALLSNDFDAFSAVCDLPYRCSTIGNEIELLTIEDVRRAFDNMCEKFKLMGITHLVRYTEVAEFKAPDRIEATHISSPMAGSARLEEPYPVFSVILRKGGVWKISSGDYALGPKQPQAVALRQGQSNVQNMIGASYAED